MFKVLKPNGNKIHVTISDKDELEKRVKGIMDGISDTDKFLSTDNKELAMHIFKRLLMVAVTDSVTIHDNTGYIIYVTVDEEPLKFSCTKVVNEKLGTGYSIALTLQE